MTRHVSPSITRIEAAIDLAEEMAAQWGGRVRLWAAIDPEEADYCRQVEREAADTAKLRRHRLLKLAGGPGA